MAEATKLLLFSSVSGRGVVAVVVAGGGVATGVLSFMAVYMKTFFGFKHVL